MANRIEEAFNDCFERLSRGESLDSCLSSYPEQAMELDLMLRVAFDVKRRAYPVQPRPEFKYWSRVRLQGVQDYMSRQAAPQKASPFNYRRNLAISVAGLLVLVIASSGTAAASYESMPDQPLYGVKMAVEQAQLTLAVSDVDKAEVYANLAGKRAHEIEAMARQGKADYLASTSARMDYQLDQAESYIVKYQAANTAVTAATTQTATAVTSAAEVPAQPAQSVPSSTTRVKPPFTAVDGKTGSGQTTIKRPLPPGATNVNRAKTALNSSTAKSLAALQDALAKAPESARPAIINAIERIKKANEWSQRNVDEDTENQDQEEKPKIIIPTPENLPLKPLPDGIKPRIDDEGHIIVPDKPRYVPPLSNNLPYKDPLPFNKPVSPGTVIPGGINNQTGEEDAGVNTEEQEVNVQNMRTPLPVTPLIPRVTDTSDSPTLKVFVK